MWSVPGGQSAGWQPLGRTAGPTGRDMCVCGRGWMAGDGGDGRGLLKMWAAEAMIYSEDFTQWSEIT